MIERTVYALGFFDGVHLGHQALLKTCRQMANANRAGAGVVTFSSHPDTLVFGTTPPLINTHEDRAALLHGVGKIDRVVSLPFDKAMMDMPWQDFFHLLTEKYGAAGLVCGADFCFGRRGEGNARLLLDACRSRGIPCQVVPEQKLNGITVSSTYIRQLLRAGEMERANAFLHHPHVLTGKVVPGQQLGRTIGIPTANLHLPEGVVCPRFGVYGSKVTVDGETYLAVTNVGVRPTVGGQSVTVEPWILDFDRDIYGKTLKLEFYRFLRPEVKFPNLTALQQEIWKNARQVREIFE